MEQVSKDMLWQVVIYLYQTRIVRLIAAREQKVELCEWPIQVHVFKWNYLNLIPNFPEICF